LIFESNQTAALAATRFTPPPTQSADLSDRLRIHVTGNAGAGKTTLAARIGNGLNLPVHSLDSVVWQPHWRKTCQAERSRLENDLTRENSWVIDGVSAHVRTAADLVVVLDYPRRVCLYRAAKRSLPFLFRSRPELPENCPEILILPRLLRIILRFPRLIGTQLLEESQGSSKYHFVKSNKELETLLASLNCTRPTAEIDKRLNRFPTISIQRFP